MAANTESFHSRLPLRPRPAGQRAKPWAYTLKPRPSDAVANMAVIDAVYRMAGLAPRRSTQPLARPKL